MGEKAFFSVIIPVYNRKTVVHETIESVLSQQFGSCEVIVIDDGSTDGTGEVLRRYQDSVTILYQKNQGAEAARNRGVEHAGGSYLVFLDSDDILFPGALETYHRVITRENNPGLLFARCRGFTESRELGGLQGIGKEQIRYVRYEDYLSKREPVWLSTSFLILKKEVWNERTCFKRGTFPVDDLDFMLRI